MKNFKQLKVWVKGMEIAHDAFEFISRFPKEERFGISQQITRAAVSISSNIAEGSSRNSGKDYKRFLEISLGSTFELETQVLLAMDLKFGDQLVGNKLLAAIDEEQKMLMAFINKLKA